MDEFNGIVFDGKGELKTVVCNDLKTFEELQERWVMYPQSIKILNQVKEVLQNFHTYFSVQSMTGRFEGNKGKMQIQCEETLQIIGELIHES